MSTGQAAGTGVAGERFSRREVLLVFSGLVLAMLTALLNPTVVSTALPTIVGDLGGVEQLSGVVTPTSSPRRSRRPSGGSSGTSTAASPSFWRRCPSPSSPSP